MSLNPTIRVKAAMNRKMVTLNKNLNIKSAIKLMVRKNIGSVIITEANNNPVGIVTERYTEIHSLSTYKARDN
jgi:predicted transcriptional regulator